MGYYPYLKALSRGVSLSQRFTTLQYPLIWEQGVGGSNPLAPTSTIKDLRHLL